MNGTAIAYIVLALGLALVYGAYVRLRIWLDQVEKRFAMNAARAATPATVTAAIEDLRTALAQVNATNRREFGAIWKRLGLSRRVAEAEEELPIAGDAAAKDDSFGAMLALQSAPPVKPQ